MELIAILGWCFAVVFFLMWAAAYANLQNIIKINNKMLENIHRVFSSPEGKGPA